VKCKHCGVELKNPENTNGWLHITGLGRCQSPDVEYGHLAEPEGSPCRADGPNPCLGAFR
jgi:hypothetical protein